jgi:Fe2+ transport system protein FeoA
MRRPRTDGLAGVRVGSTVRLAGSDLAVAERLRLAEFGLRPGALVNVLARTAGGGRVVGVGPSRVAIDRATAARIAVEEAA